MRGFLQIPSVVQIWLAQMLVLLFLSDPVIRLVNVIARPKTGILKTKWLQHVYCTLPRCFAAALDFRGGGGACALKRPRSGPETRRG